MEYSRANYRDRKRSSSNLAAVYLFHILVIDMLAELRSIAHAANPYVKESANSIGEPDTPSNALEEIGDTKTKGRDFRSARGQWFSYK